ncbi:MAG: pyridoxamine 5'-phosphate oxidase family protein [Coriobacteriales bacterium]|nr:pyridoxamine 5'-phosphate oxidase family protein [Coriobacteriales bacterium]
MGYDDIVGFVRDMPFTLATVDGDQPHVRACLTVMFDDGLIHFTTTAAKGLGSQLRRNPKAELCYLAPDFSRMLRITTELEEVDDRPKKQFLCETRDYLKAARATADDPDFMRMRVTHGSAWFWTLADNLNERNLERIEF